MQLEQPVIPEGLTIQDAPKPGKKLKRLRLRGDWSDTGPDARYVFFLLFKVNQ